MKITNLLILLTILFLFGCATKHNYKYNSIDEFLSEYMSHQYMETQEVQMIEVEDENSLD